MNTTNKLTKNLWWVFHNCIAHPILGIGLTHLGTKLHDWSGYKMTNEDDELMGSLEREIQGVLNRHSAENMSDTPDYILAQYLLGCLDAFNKAVVARDAWWDPESNDDNRPIEVKDS